MINYLVPNFQIIEQANAVKTALAGKGIADADMIGFIVGNFYKNARVFTAKNLDFWLGFGGYLPEVEWVIAKAKGETEDEFYARTLYPKMIVEAYSVPNNDLATLVAADLYMQGHRTSMPPNTTVWTLNLNDGQFIDLAQFDARITGLPAAQYL